MKRKSGFTLIEFLVVIAITSVLVTVSGSSYFGLRSRVAFENQISEIAADLKWTMSRSLAQESNDQWGVRFSNPSGGAGYYEIWHGTSYASGTVVGRTDLHGSVAFSDPVTGATKDIVFLKSTGLPMSSASLVLYSTGSGATGTIDVNSQGRVDYTFD